MTTTAKLSCIICRKNIVPLENSASRNTERQKRQFASWRTNCGASLCQILFGSVPLSFYRYFQREEYCSLCSQTVRDVDLTLRQIKSLENRTNGLLSKIRRDLEKNYDCIEEKTSQGILEERIVSALSTTDDNKEYLDKYSYDEVVEIVHEATTKQDRYFLSFAQNALIPMNEIKNDDDDIPFTIKMELGDKEHSDSFDESSVCEQLKSPDFVVEDDDRSYTSDIADILQEQYSSNEEECNNSSSSFKSMIGMADVHISKINDILSGDEYDESNTLNNLVESSEDSNYGYKPRSNRFSLKRKVKDFAYSNYGEDIENSSDDIKLAKRSVKIRSKRKSIRYKSIQPKLPKVECTICNQMITPRCMEGHLRTHTGEKPFLCEECGMKFTNPGSLGKHMQHSHGTANPTGYKKNRPTFVASIRNECVTRKRRYHCDLCSWTLNFKFRYLRHLKDKHLHKDVQNGDTFCFHYCDAKDCVYSFTSVSSLRNHIIETHLSNDESKLLLECETCQKPFVHQLSLDLHKKSHEKNCFQCQYCPVKISSRKDLKYHTPRHEIVFSESLFKHLCGECGEGFTRLRMLKKHLASLHRGNKPKTVVKSFSVFCNICQRGVPQKTLESHMIRIHTNPEGFKCSKCDAIRGTPESLAHHEHLAHRQRPIRAAAAKNVVKKREIDLNLFTKVGDDKVMCKICNDQMYALSCKGHMYTHTNPEGFPCSKCTVIKKSPKQLEYHVFRCHPPEQVSLPKLFRNADKKCHICNNKKFRQMKPYRRHLILHHPEEHQLTHPHVCKFCWSVFEQEEGRNSHIEKSHSASVCTFEGCGKSFTMKSRLLTHMNIHNNVKPYKCPYCKKEFSNNGNCYSHIHMVHTKHRSVRCKLCPENPGYYVKKEFIKHAIKTHPEISEKQYSGILEHQKPPESLKIEIRRLENDKGTSYS